ncbi:DUF4192 family protein [Planococcus sp. APC 4015]|nr:DUF4192 family protein [Planococcus sp. APC 4015]
MTTIVKAADAAQFLSLIPRMLGFTPRQSLVLIPFDGTRSLGAMRFDLPDDDAVDRVAATVVGMACRVTDADAIALVVYTDDPVAERPHAAFAAALESRADACGLHVNDALWVTAGGWGRYGVDTAPGALTELAHVGGDDQTSGAELPAVRDEEIADVARALDGFISAVHVLCGPDAAAAAPEDDDRVDPMALAAVCALDDLPTLFEEMLDWDPTGLDPYRAATIAWVLARPSLRDIALVQWCAGMDAGDEALDAQLRWESGEPYPPHLAMQMWGEGERPDPERLNRVLALVRRAAATAPEPMRAGPLATAAWISWALGRSTHADLYAMQACEAEPEHGLAEIVRSFVGAGHLPDWAFRR